MDSRSSHAAPFEMDGTRLAMPLSEGLPPPAEPDSTTRNATTSNSSLTYDSDNHTAQTSPRQIAQRTTPPSGRLLAPTQASAAKATPPSLKYRKPLPSARLSSISKLPRRDTSAPRASTAAPKWAARVAKREEDNEASNQYLREKSPQVMASSGRAVPSEKPLPPRPVASLVSAISPSKDGRSLIDASERPMRGSAMSTGDDWPTLTPSITPRSFSAPERDSGVNTKVAPSGIPRRTSGNTLTTAAVSNLTTSADERDVSHSRTSVLTGRSSIPSFVSAEESVGGDARSESASVVEASPRNDASPHPDASASHDNHVTTPYRGITDFPPRSHSLAHSGSFSDLTPETGDHLNIPAISDDTKAKVDQASEHEGRKQGASAANFSRLHGAVHPHRTSLSSLHTPGTDRTASRIPIIGNKKATLVHLKTQNLGSDPEENSPTFGSRRLVSPRALAILDQGTKRRLRLQRANTNNSDASDRSQLVGHTVRNLRTSRHSGNSSPSYTTGVSDSDSDEISTPVSLPSLPRSGTMAKLTPEDPDTAIYEPALSSSPIDHPRLRRVPPSKSRLTRPLETIPSQSMLIADRPEVGTVSRGRFSKVADQLAKAQVNNPHSRHSDTLRRASRSELRGILSAAQTEDDVRQRDGVPGYDIETKNHLTRTLSQLEGQGTPPNDFVEYDKLHAMFGNFGSGLSAAPKTNTFIDNATAANMFLERGSVSSEQVEPGNPGDNERFSAEPYHKGLAVGTANSTPVISKWSDSTPSALGESTELPRSKVPSSIGFPSATPSATNIPSFTADSFFAEEESSDPAIATRNSSPTLGSDKLHQEKSVGSVKLARENMSERGDIARMTRASLSKKTARTPTSASRGLRKPQGSVRGRDSNSTSAGIKSPQASATRGHLDERAGRTQTVSSTSNPPRSRSKGRTLLNKMAGVFSHKREKKSQQVPVPPLPPLDLSSPTPPLPTMPAAHQDESLPSVSESDHDQAITSVVAFTEELISKARAETSDERKSRQLNFAKVLIDGMRAAREAGISAREAGISAEMARQAAVAAELSFRKAKEAVQMLERLASSLVKDSARR